MARRTTAEAEAFRAVITTTSPKWGERTVYEGPYSRKGTATARVTEAVNWQARYGPKDRTVVGHVEKAATTWERVS